LPILAIVYHERILRQIAKNWRIEIQNLARIGRYHPINLHLLFNATEDPDPNICVAALAAITDLVLASFSTSTMSDSPKVQMTFNAPVYGAAGNIEGDQIINVPAQDFAALLTDYKQFINTPSRNIQIKFLMQPFNQSSTQNSKKSKRLNPNAGKIFSISNASGMVPKKLG
jgi:hypothetical protein